MPMVSMYNTVRALMNALLSDIQYRMSASRIIEQILYLAKLICSITLLSHITLNHMGNKFSQLAHKLTMTC